MAKHIVKMDCKEPGCKHAHDIEVDLPEPQVIQGTMTTVPQINPGLQQQTQMMPPPQPEKPKKLSHEEMAEMIPKGINVMKCPGGDCGHQKIKNPKKTKKYKSCPHCSANTLPKGTDTCPYCTKSIDEDEELDDGIELEDDEE